MSRPPTKVKYKYKTLVETYIKGSQPYYLILNLMTLPAWAYGCKLFCLLPKCRHDVAFTIS